jgi:hypothetical protein
MSSVVPPLYLPGHPAITTLYLLISSQFFTILCRSENYALLDLFAMEKKSEMTREDV